MSDDKLLLQQLAPMIEQLRHRLLFDFDETGLEPVAEQHFLASIALLDTAQRHMTLANLSQMNARVMRIG